MTDSVRLDLEQHHSMLNRDGIIDPTWYRRDSPPYELVCYINHVVAAYCSNNHEVMEIFLRRAHEWLTRSPNRSTIPDGARTSLLKYLTAVTKFLAGTTVADNSN